MTSRTDETARRWMDEGTRLFLGALADLGDDDLDRPLALPGWTGRHVVAHVHYNARALGRLVQWAMTGAENRMYASPEQRASEIEAGATRPAAELRDLVQRSADDLAAALDALPARARDATVVTAQGRSVPATEIPWMRAREVCVHAVDLGAGITFGDLPADFTAALLANVVRKRAGPARDRSSPPGSPAGYRPRPSWPPGYEPNGFGGAPCPRLTYTCRSGPSRGCPSASVWQMPVATIRTRASSSRMSSNSSCSSVSGLPCSRATAAVMAGMLLILVLVLAHLVQAAIHLVGNADGCCARPWSSRGTAEAPGLAEALIPAIAGTGQQGGTACACCLVRPAGAGGASAAGR